MLMKICYLLLSHKKYSGAGFFAGTLLDSYGAASKIL
jgi:hypothetical protein